MTDEIEAIRREAEQDYLAAREEATMRLQNQMTFADAALKAMLLANGGAMVALFTFVGNVVGKGGSTTGFNATSLWWAFACFVAGLILALICHLFAFFSQEKFYIQTMEEVWRNQRTMLSGERIPRNERETAAYSSGTNAVAAGLIATLLSISMFAVGCGFALAGVLLH